MRVGSLEIHPVRDGWARMPAGDLLRFTGDRGDPWLPHEQFIAPDGTIELSLGGFLVRTGDRVVIIDAGAGRIDNDHYHGGQFLESLAALAVTPDDVTDVVFTHLHFDHVGWATRQGEVVFRNATYRCNARDWAHFVGPDPGATRKLSPLAGQLQTWDASGPLLAGIDVLAAPGHTPGSTVVVISSGSERALLLGDVVHCPVQLVDDEWAIMGDVDPDLARRTRNELAAELESLGTVAAGAHFAGMRFGRLLPASGRRYWSTVGI